MFWFLRSMRRQPKTEVIMAALDDLRVEVGRVADGIDRIVAALAAAPADNTAVIVDLAATLHAAADKADAAISPPAPAPVAAPAPAEPAPVEAAPAPAEQPAS